MSLIQFYLYYINNNRYGKKITKKFSNFIQISQNPKKNSVCASKKKYNIKYLLSSSGSQTHSYNRNYKEELTN